MPTDLPTEYKDWIKRVYFNCKELIEEAELLYKHGHTKRATYLAITAYEEMVKLTQITKRVETFKHSQKLKHFKIAAEQTVWSSVQPQISVLLQKTGLTGQIKIEALLNKLLKDCSQAIGNAFDLEKIRQTLLYEDKNSSIHAQLISDKKTLTALFRGLIRSTNNILKKLEG